MQPVSSAVFYSSVSELDALSDRHLTVALNGAGRSGNFRQWHDLCTQNIHHFNGIHFATALSSLVRGLDCAPVPQYIIDFIRAAIVPALIEQCHTFDAWSIGSVSWGLAMLGIHSRPAFQRLSEWVQQNRGLLNPKDISLCAKAFSSTGHHDEALFNVLVTAFLPYASACTNSELINIGNSFGKERIRHQVFIDTLVSTVQERLAAGQTSSRDLAGYATMFTHLRQDHYALYQQLRSAFCMCVVTQTASYQDLIEFAWACTMHDIAVPEIIHALVAVVPYLYQTSSPLLATAAWTLAAVDKQTPASQQTWDQLLTIIEGRFFDGSRIPLKGKRLLFKALSYLRAYRPDVWQHCVAQQLYSRLQQDWQNISRTMGISSQTIHEAMSAAFQRLAAKPHGAELVGRVTTPATICNMPVGLLCERSASVAFEALPQHRLLQTGGFLHEERFDARILNGYGIPLHWIPEATWNALGSPEAEEEYLASFLQMEDD